MKFTFLTDEASQKPDEFIALAKKHAINSLELRKIDGRHCFHQSAAERGLLKSKLQTDAITVCCIASPVFKCPIDAPLDTQLAMLDRAIDYAAFMNAPLVRIFSFWFDDELSTIDPRILTALNRALDLASDRPVCLVLENGRQTMHRTGSDLIALYEHLNRPELAFLWDPGNCIFGQSDLNPIENSYPLIKKRIRHVHIKDPKTYRMGHREYVPLGFGDFDIKKQLSELSKLHYSGFISLETHWRPNRVIPADALHYPGDAEFSRGGYDATDRSLNYLKTLQF